MVAPDYRLGLLHYRNGPNAFFLQLAVEVQNQELQIYSMIVTIKKQLLYT